MEDLPPNRPNIALQKDLSSTVMTREERRKDGTAVVVKCLVCRKKLRNGVQCSECGVWFHLRCTNSEECVAEGWKCTHCGVGNHQSRLLEKDEVIARLRRDLEGAEERIKELLTQNSELKRKIEGIEAGRIFSRSDKRMEEETGRVATERGNKKMRATAFWQKVRQGKISGCLANSPAERTGRKTAGA